jgi:hypothetical protein
VRTKGKRTTAQAPNQQGKMLDLMQQLVQLNRQQELYALPSTKDVAFPVIRQNKIHTFVFTVDVANISVTSTTPAAGAYSITMNQFPTYNNFTSTFDAYRIITAKVIFNPTTSVGSTTTSNIPPITTAIDYDDSATPSSANLSDRDTAMVVPAGRYFERTFNPKAANALYGGSFTSFGQVNHPWVDSAYSGVIHYGLKYYIGPAGVNQPIYDVQIRVIAQFKNNI